jgi:hypothetical protein
MQSLVDERCVSSLPPCIAPSAASEHADANLLVSYQMLSLDTDMDDLVTSANWMCCALWPWANDT